MVEGVQPIKADIGAPSQLKECVHVDGTLAQCGEVDACGGWNQVEPGRQITIEAAHDEFAPLCVYRMAAPYVLEQVSVADKFGQCPLGWHGSVPVTKVLGDTHGLQNCRRRNQVTEPKFGRGRPS